MRRSVDAEEVLGGKGSAFMTPNFIPPVYIVLGSITRIKRVSGAVEPPSEGFIETVSSPSLLWARRGTEGEPKASPKGCTMCI